MGFLSRMKRRYPKVPIGYSGHEAPTNVDAVKVAVSMGAALLERHVGLPTDTITLNKYSMAPKQVDAWVRSALCAREIGSNGGARVITDAEVNALRSLKRGVYAARRIKKGRVIKQEDVFFAMPCQPGQTISGELGQYRATLIASKQYKPEEPIFEQAEPDLVSVTRSIIHDAKGMIYEAHIELGDDFEIELSHHYGMEQFREVGALIVNLINREYCKKLVVMLPGQKHPNHRHKIKEETFQLLRGDLEVTRDGALIRLKPGDKLLIERGMWHGFTTEGGAIFEEVSTTHHRGDSYYEDEAISRLDPMQRKTIIENW